MRKAICLLGLMLCVCLTASAQDSKFDIFGGFNYLHVSDPNNKVDGKNGVLKGFGFTGSAAYNWNRWFAIVGEGAYDHYDSIPNELGTKSAYTISYMGGPKVIPFKAGPIRPFVQVLMGGIHPGGDLGKSKTGFTEAFAMAAGGGADWVAGKHLAIRLAQFEYMLTRLGFNNTPNFKNQNDWRYSGGVVFRLGGK